jgi:phosphoribosylformylglycinamidine synthase subunit PurL
VTAVHDLSDGGLLIALAEMAIASGIGAVLEAPPGVAAHGFWFGEDQARYVITAKDPEAIIGRARAAGIKLTRLGATGGAFLTLEGAQPLPITDLKKGFEGWLPAYMAGAA